MADIFPFSSFSSSLHFFFLSLFFLYSSNFYFSSLFHLLSRFLLPKVTDSLPLIVSLLLCLCFHSIFAFMLSFLFSRTSYPDKGTFPALLPFLLNQYFLSPVFNSFQVKPNRFCSLALLLVVFHFPRLFQLLFKMRLSMPFSPSCLFFFY